MSRVTRSLSLSWHLVALVLAAIVPVLILSTIMVKQFVDYERQASERRLLAVASNLSNGLEEELLTSIRALQVLATSDEVQSQNLHKFHEMMKRVKLLQPSWLAVLLQASEKETILSSAQPFGKKLEPATEPNSLIELFKTGNPQVGSLVQDVRGVWGFAVRVPVLKDNKVIYALTAVITPEALQNSLFDPQTITQGEWMRSIVNHDNQIVARSINPEKFVGNLASQAFRTSRAKKDSGVFLHTSLDGDAIYVAFKATPILNWTASVSVLADVLDAPEKRAMTWVVLTGSLLILIFGGIALYYSRKLANEIRDVSVGAQVLAQGGEPSIPMSRVLEVERLRESLLSAAKLLRSREDERNEHLQQAQVARVDAEEANRAKGQFLANMSHEIRTPLGIVMGLVDLLADEEIPKEDRPQSFQIIQRNSQLLLRLINDILDFSKVDANKLQVEKVEFSLSELMSNVFEEWDKPARDKNIQLKLSSQGKFSDLIHSDPVRLRQILYNVLGNAIKFTPKGVVQVELRKQDELLHIVIADSGIGISPEHQKNLFTIFSQADTRYTRQFGGTGLGLALSKRIAQLLGGDLILLESELGKGSKFQISIAVS